MHEGIRNTHKSLVGKLEGKRPKHREDNSETDSRGTGYEGIYWIDLAQDRFDSGYFYNYMECSTQFIHYQLL
jgi:hypothetical protein